MKTGACLILLSLLLACDPNTTRPRVVPFPDDASTDSVRAKTPAATERLLAALTAEDIPIAFSSTKDGYVQSPWLNAETLKPTDARPIGMNVVRIRGWVNPFAPGYSTIIVEAAYRPYADPSLPERELERPLPKDHPVRLRLDTVLLRIPKNRAGIMAPLPPPPPQPVDSSSGKSDK